MFDPIEELLGLTRWLSTQGGRNTGFDGCRDTFQLSGIKRCAIRSRVVHTRFQPSQALTQLAQCGCAKSREDLCRGRIQKELNDERLQQCRRPRSALKTRDLAMTDIAKKQSEHRLCEPDSTPEDPQPIEIVLRLRLHVLRIDYVLLRE